MRSSPSSARSRRATSACQRAGRTRATTTGTDLKIAIFGSGGVGGYFGARIAAPGVIEHTGTMARLRFGAVLPSQRPAAEKFLKACQQAGIMAELVDDIVLVNWEKFVFLVALSSASTVSRAPLGVVRSDPELRWAFEQAMRETWRLGRTRGIKLSEDFVEKQL